MNSLDILYKALRVTEENGKYVQTIEELHTKDLPEGDVLVNVFYSSLNYKDALSATGNKGVTRKYPHTPGIDATGVVVASDDERFKPGDEVIVTGYDLGMNTPGGFGAYIRVPADWIVLLPSNLTMKEAMIIGTAGFTAGISVTNLVEKIGSNDGKIVVTGATGGVGSVAVNLLVKLGYDVIAVTGKESEFPYLKSIGATDCISRSDFLSMENKPLLSARYAGGIDTVGGPMLENILRTLQPFGVVTTCGNVISNELHTSIFPFILRSVRLIGISAQNYPMPLRKTLWQKLANEWKPDQLMQIYNEIGLEQLPDAIDKILQGRLKGRTLVKIRQ